MWLGIDLQISSLKLRGQRDVWLTVNLITISVTVYVRTHALVMITNFPAI